MATRWYLHNQIADIAVSTRGLQIATLDTHSMGVDKIGTPAEATAVVHSGGFTNLPVLKFVGPPLAAQTITGSLTTVVLGRSTLGTDTGRGYIHVWATQGSTDALRATIVSNDFDAALTWDAASAGRQMDSTATSTVVQAGDRIVVEIGVSRNAATATTCGVYRGGTGADLAVGGTSTATPGWVEFLQTLLLQSATPVRAYILE